MVAADAASTTNYAYQGNVTTVTDPAVNVTAVMRQSLPVGVLIASIGPRGEIPSWRVVTSIPEPCRVIAFVMETPDVHWHVPAGMTTVSPSAEASIVVWTSAPEQLAAVRVEAKPGATNTIRMRKMESRQVIFRRPRCN